MKLNNFCVVMKNLLSSIIFYGFVSLLYCNYIELIISKNKKEEKRTKKTLCWTA